MFRTAQPQPTNELSLDQIVQIVHPLLRHVQVQARILHHRRLRRVIVLEHLLHDPLINQHQQRQLPHPHLLLVRRLRAVRILRHQVQQLQVAHRPVIVVKLSTHSRRQPRRPRPRVDQRFILVPTPHRFPPPSAAPVLAVVLAVALARAVPPRLASHRRRRRPPPRVVARPLAPHRAVAHRPLRLARARVRESRDRARDANGRRGRARCAMRDGIS